MSTPDLLPCPFCGSSAHIDYNTDNDWPRVVECDNDECEAMGPWGKREHNHEESMKYIVSKWNSRVRQKSIRQVAKEYLENSESVASAPMTEHRKEETNGRT